MTAEEKSRAIEALKHLQALDLDKIQHSTYGNNPPSTIGGFLLSDVNPYLIRAMAALENALSTVWEVVPFAWADGISEATLVEKIDVIVARLKKRTRLDTWRDELIWLLEYVRKNGLSDLVNSREREGDKYYLPSSEGIASLMDELLRKRDEAQIIVSQMLERNALSEQISKQNERAYKILLTDVQGDASQAIEKVRQAELEVATNNGKATALLEQLMTSIDSAQKDNEKVNIDYNRMLANFNLLQNSLEASISLFDTRNENFKGILDSAQEKEKHILDQKDEIAKLRGFAADIALGSVFDHRQNQMKKQVWVWSAASLVAVVAAAAWIYYVFSTHDSQTDTGINWLVWLANGVRTSPAVILVYFCLAQYTKERNIQEEYAFKAAVSMTVTAYADMIGDGVNEERTKMLMTTIQGIYTPPVLGKPLKPLSFKTKDVAESSKSMAEAMKSVQTMVSDALKAAKSSDK